MLKRTVLCSLAAMTLLAWSAPLKPEASPSFPSRPKLVVVLVIDQFRYDYLMRFRPFFGKGGFNRLLEGGAVFTDCRYDYATTMTGPGHATLLTGAYPNVHGIIENNWYDRERSARSIAWKTCSTRTGGEPREGQRLARIFAPQPDRFHAGRRTAHGHRFSRQGGLHIPQGPRRRVDGRPYSLRRVLVRRGIGPLCHQHLLHADAAGVGGRFQSAVAHQSVLRTKMAGAGGDSRGRRQSAVGIRAFPRRNLP